MKAVKKTSLALHGDRRATMSDSPPPERKMAGKFFIPGREPMPEFILIRREKKDLVRRLVVRAGIISLKKEKALFELKIHDIIAEGGDQVIEATEFLRKMRHGCAFD